MQDKIKQLIADIQAGDHKALARGITIVENNIPGYEDILLQLNFTDMGKVIGITGPPGAGKSTLVNALLQHWVKEGKKIAVIAVDPSSPFNFGALLGDRIRLNNFYNNPNVYIRSLASRGALGGLSNKIIEITDLVKTAPFDIIMVETVGVGQSEVEIAGLADCSIVALVPEAGDEVQTLKAGIMEIADIFVVNKADRDAANALFASIRMMVHEKAGDDDEVPVLKTIATSSTGIAELAIAIEAYLETSAAQKDKKAALLTEKCWQLIQASCMKEFDKQEIRKTVEKHLSDSGFNIYNYTNQLLEQNAKR